MPYLILGYVGCIQSQKNPNSMVSQLSSLVLLVSMCILCKFCLKLPQMENDNRFDVQCAHYQVKLQSTVIH